MISSINLKGLLDDNHEEEAARLAKSVTAWLDAEVRRKKERVCGYLLLCEHMMMMMIWTKPFFFLIITLLLDIIIIISGCLNTFMSSWHNRSNVPI
jgi:hypothetical protein